MATFDRQFDFFISEFGEPILINDLSTKGYMEIIGDTSADYFVDRILNTVEPVETGDVVNYQNYDWLALKQMTIYPNYKSTRIRRCDWYTNIWYKGLDIAYTYPSIYAFKSVAIAEGSTISIADGKIVCCLQSNSITDKIDVDFRFIKFNSAWKVTGVDKTEKGLIYMYADKDAIAEGDDLVNELVAGSPQPDTYEIIIFPDISPSIAVGDFEEIDINVSKNGESFDYDANDISIQTYDENTLVEFITSTKKLKVTGVNVGNSTFDIVYRGGLAKYKINTNVTAEQEREYSVVIDNSAPIELNLRQEQEIYLSIYRYGSPVMFPTQSKKIYSADPEGVIVIKNNEDTIIGSTVGTTTLSVTYEDSLPATIEVNVTS